MLNISKYSWHHVYCRMRILSRIDTVSRYDICPNLSRVLKCLSSLLRVLFGLPRAWSDELFRHQNKFELPPARVQALTSTKQLSSREKDKKYPAQRILSLPARSHQESDILYKTECGGSDFLLASNGSASCYSAAPGVFLLFAPVKLLRFVMASVLLARFCLSQSGEGCDRWWGWAGPSEQVLIIALLSSLSSAETDSQWRQQFLGGVDPQSSGIYNLNLHTNNLWSLHSQIASNNVDETPVVFLLNLTAFIIILLIFLTMLKEISFLFLLITRQSGSPQHSSGGWETHAQQSQTTQTSTSYIH